MSEVDRKRGWWSRITGTDGQSAEETIQELAQELTAAREMIDTITSERELQRESSTKRLDEQAAATQRARAETEQLRRAAESQLGALRAKLEAARQEHVKERAAWELKLREALLAEKESATRITSLQRDLGLAGKEQAAVRQAFARSEQEAARLRVALAEARTQLATLHAQHQELDSEIADTRTSLLELRSRYEDEVKARSQTRAAGRQLRHVSRLALEHSVGPDGADLATAIAWREAPIDRAFEDVARDELPAWAASMLEPR